MLRSLYRNIKNFFLYFLSGNIKIGKNVATNRSILEGNNKINDNTVFVNGRLGFGTYLGANCNFNATEIGRYCSIGSFVKVLSANHPTRDFVSTHPAFFSLSKQAGFTYTSTPKFQEQKLLDIQKGISVSIGNDVWIGEEVIIIGGVTICDGAVIGARAVVTKDVPPYTKVGGIPAKVIGKRFTEDEIAFLLNLQWWNKGEPWIVENAPLFSDIHDLMKKIV